MSICSDFDDGGCISNTTWQGQTQISTSVAFSRRSATTVYERYNGTMVAVSNLSAPTPEVVSVNDLFVVLDFYFTPSNLSTTTDDYIRWLYSYISAWLSSASPV